MSTAPTIAMLPLGDLTIGDDFRLDDDPYAVGELAESIGTYGVLQPLLVRPSGKGYQVVAGRRRLAASRSAGLDAVPCVIRDLTDDEALDATLVENLHRRDLSPIEVAMALARMRDEKGLTQVAIAQRIGRSQYYVSVIIRLLDLPKRVQNKVHAGKMSYVTAYDHWNRESTGKRQGKSGTHNSGEDADFRVLSHWRRRHDRLLAGVHAVVKARPEEWARCRMMLDRLLKLDKEPFPEEAVPSERQRRP